MFVVGEECKFLLDTGYPINPEYHFATDAIPADSGLDRILHVDRTVPSRTGLLWGRQPVYHRHARDVRDCI